MVSIALRANLQYTNALGRVRRCFTGCAVVHKPLMLMHVILHRFLVCCCWSGYNCVIINDRYTCSSLLLRDGPVLQRLCLWVALYLTYLSTFVLTTKPGLLQKCKWLECDSSHSSLCWSGPALHAQVTKLANGVTVASQDKCSPFSNVSVYVRGGSRVETYSQQGLSHFMSVCAPLVSSCSSGLRTI